MIRLITGLYINLFIPIQLLGLLKHILLSDYSNVNNGVINRNFQKTTIPMLNQSFRCGTDIEKSCTSVTSFYALIPFVRSAGLVRYARIQAVFFDY